MSESESYCEPIDDGAAAAPAEKPRRLTSLDAFRGLTIAGMILVNNAGGTAFPPLRHAEWDGLTPTDLVFPFFVFIVGVSIPFSFGNRRAGGSGTFGLIFRILRRALLIFGIGILLHAFPTFDNWATIRIPGVLQRIALCYLFASILALLFGPRGLFTIAVILLVGYASAMLYVPVPDGATGSLERGYDLASYIDRLLLPNHIYREDYDPEGILSTIPAIASALFGVLAGLLLKSKRTDYEKVALLSVGATAALLAGYFWSGGFPINKALWTPPFVLITGGFAGLLLGLFYWLIEIQGRRAWSTPLVVFGTNAIAAYVLAGLLSRVVGMITWTVGDKTVNPRSYLVSQVFAKFAEPMEASLLWSLLFVSTCFLVILALYVKKIFIKV
ncbi:MAG: heparan-alpha-glucosaminide N-acetyltransferase domain-containing protein [Isosphaeraceae bacterium]|nr:heparan-alpha-glucosaminide N-acetyltransferase domain-containing protein [Isosphaeraceae bacterium]